MSNGIPKPETLEMAIHNTDSDHEIPAVDMSFVDQQSPEFSPLEQIRSTVHANIVDGQRLLEAFNTDLAATYSKHEIVDIFERNGINADDMKSGFEALRAHLAPLTPASNAEILSIKNAELTPVERDLVRYVSSEEKLPLSPRDTKVHEPISAITKVATLKHEADVVTSKSLEVIPSLQDLKKELRSRIDDEVYVRNLLRQHDVSHSRRENAEAYLSTNKERYQLIAQELGVNSVDPDVLLGRVELFLEKGIASVESLKESEKGNQIEELTNEEKQRLRIIRALEAGNGSNIPDDHLRHHQEEPRVREFVVTDILEKINAHDVHALDNIHQWRWNIAKGNAVVDAYQHHLLVSAHEAEKPAKTPAFVQLQEKDKEYPEINYDEANSGMVNALKDDLVASGMSREEVEEIILTKIKKSRKQLSPYDIVALRIRHLGKAGSNEIASQEHETVVDEKIEAETNTPPVLPIARLQEGIIQHSPVHEHTQKLVLPVPPVEPIAMVAEKPAQQVRVIVPQVSIAPTTPNEIFSEKMRALEHEANQLAQKGSLSPSEKVKLTALEQEMQSLEQSYLVSEKRAVPGMANNAKTSAFPRSEKAPIAKEAVSEASSRAESDLSDSVVHKFENTLGLDAHILESIPGFTALSEGKQLLLLRNMQNEVLGQVKRDAKNEAHAEWKGRSLWGKIWRGAVTMGAYQAARTKSIEKELLNHATNGEVSVSRRSEVVDEHIANIEEYIKVMQQTPEVVVGDAGELHVNYAPIERGVKEQEKHTIELFNLAASKFAMIPREWGYAPHDDKEKAQQVAYTEEHVAYQEARAQLLDLYIAKLTENGHPNAEKEAMMKMSRMDEQVQLNQLFIAHPNAEQALEEIEEQSAIMSGIKEFWQDKGKYVALGAGIRIATAAVFGAVTGGVGAIAISGAVGVGVGGAQGIAEAKRVMRDKRIERRLSETDEREEVSYTDMDGKAHLRRIKEYTDATFFTDRIERLTDKLDQLSEGVERALVEKKIAQTTALMEEKWKRGLINFGGSSLEERDVRKGNDIANKLSFIEAMGKGAAVEVIDQDKLKQEMMRIVGDHQLKADTVRSEEVIKTGMKTAMLRGAFAFGGAYIAGSIHNDSLTDEVFSKIKQQEHRVEDLNAGSVNGKESVPEYTPASIEQIKNAILARTDPRIPQPMMEGSNKADVEAFTVYMQTNDPAVRHNIAETLGMSEEAINARITSILSHNGKWISNATHTPEVQTASLQAETPTQSPVTHEAPTSVPLEVHPHVSLEKAETLAGEYLRDDMANTEDGSQPSMEWTLLKDRDATSVLNETREQASEREGGVDEWANISHMQQYARANGFTNASGYTPEGGETLEQYLLRAHTEKLMKEGITTRVVAPDQETLSVPQPVTQASNEATPRPTYGAIPHKPNVTPIDARTVPSAGELPPPRTSPSYQAGQEVAPNRVVHGGVVYSPRPFVPRGMP